MQFHEKLISSVAFAPGAWRVTTVTDDEGKSSIDLAWSEDGTVTSYGYYGTCDLESTALRVIELIESMTSAPDIRSSLAAARFERIPASGFSVGGESYRKTEEGLTTYLTFDGMGEVSLSRGLPGGGVERVASLSAGSPHPELRSRRSQIAIATFVISSLLAAPGQPSRSG